jgi:copper chaperone CopZ
MDRRKFLTRIMGTTASFGLAGAGTAAVHKLAGTGPTENQTVQYKVKGFTCITCATGLEVMLRELQGVVRAHASYPEATVVIGFDQDLTSVQKLKDFIAGCGFSIA